MWKSATTWLGEKKTHGGSHTPDFMTAAMGPNDSGTAIGLAKPHTGVRQI
jgi:hypothetical protein